MGFHTARAYSHFVSSLNDQVLRLALPTCMMSCYGARLAFRISQYSVETAWLFAERQICDMSDLRLTV